VEIYKSVNQLKNRLLELNQLHKSIGFVPTMGALHAGHGSLVSRSTAENDITVASIFVNPTQFNNASDLANYPKTIDSDLKLLTELNCTIVFVPDVSEIYTESLIAPEINLGFLDQVMEGEFRPGHFNGVVQVVHRLFDIVKPTRAYFGLKDFQQVAVIRYMTEYFKLPIEIIACETLRESDGLAMSSRNLRLSKQERMDATEIFRILSEAKKLKNTRTPKEVHTFVVEEFEISPLRLEYFQLADAKTLSPLIDAWSDETIGCVVAFAGEIRLIDNLFF
jgi:pantoate--beta-alanine ligase